MEVFLALGFAAHPHGLVKVLEVSEERGHIIGGYFGSPFPACLAPTDACHTRDICSVSSFVLAVSACGNVAKISDTIIGAIAVDVID